MSEDAVKAAREAFNRWNACATQHTAFEFMLSYADELLDAAEAAEARAVAAEGWNQRLLEKLSDNVGIIRGLDRRVAVAEGRDAEAPLDPIRDALGWPGVYKGVKDAALARLADIEAHVAQLKNALQTVMDNLGVPGDDYPAPVAVAYEAARSALEWKTRGN